LLKQIKRETRAELVMVLAWVWQNW